MTGAFIFFVFCLKLTFPAEISADNAGTGPQSPIDAAIARIQNEYPFRLICRDLPPSVRPAAVYQPADKSDTQDVLTYLLLFEEEIGKYPKSFFDKNHLQGVVFVKKLFNGEQPVEGFYARGEHLIFLDFLRDKGNAIIQRHNIHHEFYHMLEAEVLGDPERNDAEWSSFNDASFVYGKENLLKRVPRDTSFFTAPFPGFTSEYAMLSAKEDRAEVYGCLLMASQNKIVQRWMRKDTVLRKKVGYIKSIVHQFCEEMDEQFWQDLFSR